MKRLFMLVFAVLLVSLVMPAYSVAEQKNGYQKTTDEIFNMLTILESVNGKLAETEGKTEAERVEAVKANPEFKEVQYFADKPFSGSFALDYESFTVMTSEWKAKALTMIHPSKRAVVMFNLLDNNVSRVTVLEGKDWNNINRRAMYQMWIAEDKTIAVNIDHIEDGELVLKGYGEQNPSVYAGDLLQALYQQAFVDDDFGDQDVPSLTDFLVRLFTDSTFRDSIYSIVKQADEKNS